MCAEEGIQIGLYSYFSHVIQTHNLNVILELIINSESQASLQSH